MKHFQGIQRPQFTLFNKYIKDNRGFLLESKDKDGRYSFLCKNPFLEVEAYGQEVIIKENGQERKEFGNVLQIIKSNIERYELINKTKIPFIGGAVGTVGYDIIRQYEYLPNQNSDEMNLPDAHMMFVKEVVAYDHFLNKINIIVLEKDDEESRKIANEKLSMIKEILIDKMPNRKIITENKKVLFHSHTLEKDFVQAVKNAKSYIKDGDIFQVVLSRRLSGESNIPPFDTI